jgi:uncharacterized protein (DUF58 family)
MASGVLFEPLLTVGKWLLMALFLVVVLDALVVYVRVRMAARRDCPTRFSLGDENELSIVVANRSPLSLALEVVDELPFQFQKRDFSIKGKVEPNESKTFTYTLRPTERGVYAFGRVLLFASTGLGLVLRRISTAEPFNVKVYPSYLMLRKYELMALSNNFSEMGIKRVRRAGNNTEFEQIREEQAAFMPNADQTSEISADELRAQTQELRYTTDPQEILDQVADQIKTKVKEDMSSLEMVLHPASLGNVALNLISKDGSVSAQFTAQNEAVKAALESQLAVLKENLEQAGVRVTEVSVAVGSHAFEQNLEQGNDGQSDAEAKEQERLRRATRRIDLGLDGDMEEIDDADALTVEMMQADGNRMDHRV